jgi:hypothetical protein
MVTISSRRARAWACATVVLFLAGCGSSAGQTAAKTARVVRTTTTTEAPTTTTTLSPGECFGLIAQAQAGTLTVTEADYTTKCGALPDVGVLGVTTTTTTLPPPPPPTTPPTTRYTPPPTAAPQQNCPNGTYVNTAGNTVCSPYSAPSAPPGATAQCRDGTYSFSQSRSGTCSSHGGVAQWL